MRRADEKASAVVREINTAPATVTVSLLGASVVVRYPVWYTPRVGDLVVIDWLGSQPYVATVFA